MSHYTYRHVEIRVPILAGKAEREDKLPTDAKIGGVYRIYSDHDFPFREMTADGWIKRKECEYKWQAAPFYRKLDRRPSYMDEDSEFYKSDRQNTLSLKDSNDNDVYFKREPYFVNCGGAIRDDYISTNGWKETEFQGRGFPSDMSEETKEAIGDDTYCYSRTWVLLSEWIALSDKEEKDIIQKLLNARDKIMHRKTQRKLDFIIENLKHPEKIEDEMDLNAMFSEKDAEGEYIEEDDYYESPECVMNEEFPNLFCIYGEIAIIRQIADYYDMYGDENIRCIYYID